MNNSKPSILCQSHLSLGQVSNSGVTLLKATAANDYQYYQSKPYSIVGYTHEFKIIKKHGLILPFTRWPFIITGNDKAMLELFMIKLSEILGLEQKILWAKMLNSIELYGYSFEEKEQLLEQHLIFELINIGDGQATLNAIDKLIEMKKPLFELGKITV